MTTLSERTSLLTLFSNIVGLSGIFAAFGTLYSFVLKARGLAQGVHGRLTGARPPKKGASLTEITKRDGLPHTVPHTTDARHANTFADDAGSRAPAAHTFSMANPLRSGAVHPQPQTKAFSLLQPKGHNGGGGAGEGESRERGAGDASETEETRVSTARDSMPAIRARVSTADAGADGVSRRGGGGGGTAAAASQRLPDGWEKVVSKTHGKEYFWHRESTTTSWAHPAGE